MAQNLPQRCPRCGALAETGQRFCAECGAALGSEGNKPTELASGDAFRVGNVPGTPQGSGEVAPPTVSAASFTAPASPSYDATVIAPRPANEQPSASSPTPAPQQEAAPNSFGSTNSTVPAPEGQFYQGGAEADVIAPPPPADSYIARPQSMPSFTPAPAPTQAPGSYIVPDYARVPRRSRGCLILSVLLLLILVAGGVVIYLGFFHH